MNKLVAVLDISKSFVQRRASCTLSPPKRALSEKTTFYNSLELMKWVGIIQVEVFWVRIF